MIKLTVTDRTGATHHITAAGGTLMQAIVDADLEEIFGICGGACSCASCHVIVDAGYLPLTGPASPIETDLLDGSDFHGPGSRLSCQITLTPALDGLGVTIAPEG